MTVKVSVIMPCFNGEKYVGQAIESILDQSYTNFELIVADDASTDRSLDIIEGYLSDGRLRVVKNEKNLGISRTINMLLSLARGEYVARMDADDIALKTRLEVQTAFLDGSCEYDVVSSDMIYIDPAGRRLYKPFWSLPGRANDLLDFGCVVYHPTVMFRLEKLRRIAPDGVFYRECYSGYCEDYDLWVRAKGDCGICILKEPLLLYRIHGGNQSVREDAQMRRATLEIVRGNVADLGVGSVDESIVSLLNRPWEKSGCSRGQFAAFVAQAKGAISHHAHLRRRVALIVLLQCLFCRKVLFGREVATVLSLGDIFSALSVALKGFWRRSGIGSIFS